MEAAFFYVMNLKEFLKDTSCFDFDLGLELLKEHQPSSLLIAYFEGAPKNSFNVDYLRSTLSKVLVSLSQAKVTSEKEQEVIKPIENHSNALTKPKMPKINFAALSEELQGQYLRRNNLVRQADILKERARQCQDEKECYTLGRKILRTWNEIHTIHAKLDSFQSGKSIADKMMPDLSKQTLKELKAFKQRQMVLRSKAKSKENQIKFEYHDELIQHINKQIHVQIQRSG